jgi:geranylgeranyl pyrophosphate synthase
MLQCACRESGLAEIMDFKVLQDFTAEKAKVRAAVEAFLGHAFDQLPSSDVRDCARYVTLGGGHRWRAIVAIAAGTIFDDDALSIGLPGACGVELAHAASLVLDDLPSMDDAQLRRGKPCAHLAFPRWAVDMAPVLLVTMAFDISLANPRSNAERRVKGALLLSEAGQRMIAGQAHDVLQDYPADSRERLLLECYDMKSGALYAASAKAGAILCGANDDEAERVRVAGLNLGLSYQLMDDVADVSAAVADVGKTTGLDAGKWTAIDWLGVEGARKESRRFQEKGLAALDSFGAKADWLRRLVCEASYART